MKDASYNSNRVMVLARMMMILQVSGNEDKHMMTILIHVRKTLTRTVSISRSSNLLLIVIITPTADHAPTNYALHAWMPGQANMPAIFRYGLVGIQTSHNLPVEVPTSSSTCNPKA